MSRVDWFVMWTVFAAGVAELAAHPVKTYRLVRHGRGWYE